MKDHQLGYTLQLQPLGAKIERHQATPEDRRAMELCKFEQKRHEVESVSAIEWAPISPMHGIVFASGRVLTLVDAQWGPVKRQMLTDGHEFYYPETLGEGPSTLTGWRIIL